jgi:hypothetical protein
MSEELSTEIEYRVCSKCGEKKELCKENFRWRKEANVWKRFCRKCECDNTKLYNSNNKIERKIYFKKYKKDNINKRRETRNKSQKKRYNNDSVFRIKDLVSKSIRCRLKFNKNGKSILNFLPYTIHQLKEHLESQFESWMNWDNWGLFNIKTWDDNDSSTWVWQIDHIIPHSFFNYTSITDEEFKKCWALENLRPYSAKQNIIDGNRRTAQKDAA